MNIIDHGKWTIYTAPDELLERRGLTRQHGVVFSKRIDSSEDWYDYCEARFAQKNTVLVTLTEQPDGIITGAANTNYNFIFPANGALMEITDYTGSDPHADFSNKVFDPVNKTFTDRPVMQPPENAEVAELKKTVEGMKKLLEKLTRQ